MSYQSFKHLLGETNLERKCRFIFGGGILLLVTISFYWYGRKTESLVTDQNAEVARMLITPVLRNIHHEAIGNDEGLRRLSAELMVGQSTTDDGPHFEYLWISPYRKNPKHEPDETEQEVLRKFVQAAKNEKAYIKAGSPNLKTMRFSDGSDKYFAEVTADRKKYRYIQAVQYRPNCTLVCHSFRPSDSNSQQNTLLETGDLAAAVVIKLPMERVSRSIHQNRAVLIFAAFVTSILAMFSSYAIVRYATEPESAQA